MLALSDRLSARGGADLYLQDLVTRTGRDFEWHLVFGHQDSTGIEVSDGYRTRHRLESLSLRSRSGSENDFRAALRRVAPDALVVQNVMDAETLTLVAGSEIPAVAVLQDHRTFCPARGKVFPDGEPCHEPIGPACDRCFTDAGTLDTGLRDRRLGLVRARQSALVAFDALVVLSRYMADEVASSGLSRPRVIPPALPPPAPLGPAPGRPTVAYVGRLAWQKGVHLLVRCVADLRLSSDPPPRLLLIGDGPQRDELEALAAASGLDSVEFTGWIPRDEVGRRLAEASVLALPSLWAEPYGIAGAEAAAQRLPVVAFDVGGVREWAGPGDSLVPPNRDDLLAQALAQALTEAAGRERTDPEPVDVGCFTESWTRLLTELCGRA